MEMMLLVSQISEFVVVEFEKTCQITKCTSSKMPIAYLMESIFDEPTASGCIVGNFKKALN